MTDRHADSNVVIFPTRFPAELVKQANRTDLNTEEWRLFAEAMVAQRAMLACQLRVLSELQERIRQAIDKADALILPLRACLED